jgi:chloramphenicol O-acetyltransferase
LKLHIQSITNAQDNLKKFKDKTKCQLVFLSKHPNLKFEIHTSKIRKKKDYLSLSAEIYFSALFESKRNETPTINS